MDLLVEHDGHGNSVAQPAKGWALRTMYFSRARFMIPPAITARGLSVPCTDFAIFVLPPVAVERGYVPFAGIVTAAGQFPKWPFHGRWKSF